MKWYSVKEHQPILTNCCILLAVFYPKSGNISLWLGQYDHGWKSWEDGEEIEKTYNTEVLYFCYPDPIPKAYEYLIEDKKTIKPSKEDEDIKIEDFRFNKDKPNVYYSFDRRTIRCLINEGIETVNQLLSHCEHQLLKIPNLGKLSLIDIKTKLAYKNLKLCMLPFYYYSNSYCSKCHSCKNFISM